MTDEEKKAPTVTIELDRKTAVDWAMLLQRAESACWSRHNNLDDGVRSAELAIAQSGRGRQDILVDYWDEAKEERRLASEAFFARRRMARIIERLTEEEP